MLSKEDKKIKIGVSILTFIINEYKTWLWIESIGISKQLELSFFQNVAKTTKRSFFLYIVFVNRCNVIFISLCLESRRVFGQTRPERPL